MSIKLTVNKTEYYLDSPPDTPLLWVLRDELKLTGTKYGCGIAQWSICTVQLNEFAVRACQVALGDVEGSEVVTIEAVVGEEADAGRHAWTELDVVHCRFCQSGQIMQAISLLEQGRVLSDELIDTVMGGNACRCATYKRIRVAIYRADEILEA